MKVNGSKLITVLFENEQESIYINRHSLNYIVNKIIEKANKDLQHSKNCIDMITKYIIVNNKKYSFKSDIIIKLEISPLNINMPIVCKGYFDKKYNVEIKTEIKEFYNEIIYAVEQQAYELDTDIKDIQVTIKELKLLNNYKLEGAK